MEIPTRIYPSRKPDLCIILDSGNSITHPSLPTENESQTAVDLVYSLGPVQSYTWSRPMNAGLSPFQVLAQFPPGLRSDSEVPDCRNAPPRTSVGKSCWANGVMSMVTQPAYEYEQPDLCGVGQPMALAGKRQYIPQLTLRSFPYRSRGNLL